MTTTRATNIATLTNSIGVNVHLNDTAQPYGNLPLVLQELQYLGTTEVRDNQPYDWSLSNFQTLAAQGIRFDLIIGHNPNEEMGGGAIQGDLKLIDQIAAAHSGSINGLESLNEPYNFPNYWNGVLTNTWSIVAQVQQAEYSAVKSDPALTGVPFLGTSTDPNSFPNSTPPNMSATADFGNAHVYPFTGGQPPFVLNNILSGQSQIVPGKPAWVTEFGYSTAYLDTNYGASQLVQAKNTLNGLLDAFKAGVPHTYIYQLNDEGPNPSASDVGNSWGLFNYDGTMKRAATAIHNFTSVVSDTGAAAKSFAPGQIGFSINNLPTSGKSLLLQKSSGVYDLVVWNEPVDWDSSSHSDVTVSPTTATVSLDATYASIKVFDPMVGTAPIATYTNASSVQLGLTDHPLIVELSAGGANQPPLPPPPAPSPDGTKISSAAANPIIDQAGNAWKLVQSASNGLQIAVNGTVDPATANVVLLEILGGKIVQENTAANWYSEPGPGGAWSQIAAPVAPPPLTPPVTPPPPAPSPDGTKISSAAANPIIDQAGNAWKLVQSASNGLQIAVNGTVDPATANVVLLEILGGKIVQENTAANWYSEPGPGGAWSQIAAPVAPPPVTPPVTPPPPAPSPDGTKISSAAANPIIDQAGNAWKLVQSASNGLQIAVNGTVDPATANVVLLEILGGKIVQENTAANWYSEPGPGGAWSQIAAPVAPPPVTPPTSVTTGSGSDTMVFAVSEDAYQGDAQFTVSVDGKQVGGTFTATASHASGTSQNFTFKGDFGAGSHAVAVNFLNDAWGGTAATDRNLYVNGISYNGTATGQSAELANTGAKTFAVSGGTTPSVSETGDHGSLAKNLSQTGTYTVGGDTFVLTAGNAASVTLGTGTSQIKFIGASSVTLTGGPGLATVTADAGNNKFVAGTGTLDVTGGGGKDAYVFHATGGPLKLEDFSLAKGDTLTIDNSLQGSLQRASDGQGGTMLTFGAGATHGVDIHGLAVMPTTSITWA